MTTRDVVVVVAVVAALLFLALMPILVALAPGPHCRCGHHKRVHGGRDTRCLGYWPAGRNAIGAKQYEHCTCKSYRATGVRYWQRITRGTEEHPFRDDRQAGAQ